MDDILLAGRRYAARRGVTGLTPFGLGSTWREWTIILHPVMKAGKSEAIS